MGRDFRWGSFNLPTVAIWGLLGPGKDVMVIFLILLVWAKIVSEVQKDPKT